MGEKTFERCLYVPPWGVVNRLPRDADNCIYLVMPTISELAKDLYRHARELKAEQLLISFYREVVCLKEKALLEEILITMGDNISEELAQLQGFPTFAQFWKAFVAYFSREGVMLDALNPTSKPREVSVFVIKFRVIENSVKNQIIKVLLQMDAASSPAVPTDRSTSPLPRARR